MKGRFEREGRVDMGGGVTYLSGVRGLVPHGKLSIRRHRKWPAGKVWGREG